MTPRVTARTRRRPPPATASTSAVLYGVERGPVCGIAPGAHVIMYRVCLAEGCFSSDSVAAVQQAIADGVDVINFSISGGAHPYTDPVELAFLDASNAGISVNASAGNSGPGAATSDHGGPWVTTVGASTGPRVVQLDAASDRRRRRDARHARRHAHERHLEPRRRSCSRQSLPGEDALCQSTRSPPGTATGKVVVCQRGDNGRIDKGRQRPRRRRGRDDPLQPDRSRTLETDNHYLPAIHVDGPTTRCSRLRQRPHEREGHLGAGHRTAATRPTSWRRSRRAARLGDWIKPDVTAPGVQVLAGMTPQPDQTTADNGPAGQPVPGDRRHLDVEPARGRRLGARQGGASRRGRRRRSSRR